MQRLFFNLGLVAALIFSSSSFAGRALLQVHPLGVGPTQGVAGLSWVENKVRKFSGMNPLQLEKKLREDPAPAIINPRGKILIIDGHHEFRALADMGVQSAYVDIIANFGNWTEAEFVNEIKWLGWYYLCDASGNWVLRPESLPKDVSGLIDDPYRSLASYLRASGGFSKTKIAHAEFIWANALRTRISKDLLESHPLAALKFALEFAESDEAAGLPGYKRPSKCETNLRSN